MGWGWMIFGWIWMIGFWGTVAWLGIWTVRSFDQRKGTSSRDPIEIAKERYANGDITADEFLEI